MKKDIGRIISYAIVVILIIFKTSYNRFGGGGRGMRGAGMRSRGNRSMSRTRSARSSRNTHTAQKSHNKKHQGMTTNKGYSHGGVNRFGAGRWGRGWYGNRGGWYGGNQWGLMGGFGIGIMSGMMLGMAANSGPNTTTIINDYGVNNDSYPNKNTTENNTYIANNTEYQRGKELVLDATQKLDNLFISLTNNYDELIKNNKENNKNDKNDLFIPSAIQIQFKPLDKIDIIETNPISLKNTKTKKTKTVLFKGNQPINQKIITIQQEVAEGFDIMYKNGTEELNGKEVHNLQQNISDLITQINQVMVEIVEKII